MEAGMIILAQRGHMTPVDGYPFIAYYPPGGLADTVRSLQNHARRLESVQMDVQTGMDMDTAIKKLQPPIFFV
jgi:hypothetical protein